MQTRAWFGRGIFPLTFWLAATGGLGLEGSAQTIPAQYEKPPQAILDVLNAPVTPLLSLSPVRDVALLYTPMLYPPIADLAQPMLRLAGVRINPANNGPHGAGRYDGYLLKRIADGREIRVTLPPDAHLSPPIWSPDGQRFAFTNFNRTSVELWVGDAHTGSAHLIAGVRLNAALGAPCEWMPDSSSLLCLTAPAGRGAPPKANPVPTGPHIEESFGKAAPQPTFEDLLMNAFDEKLFDYYATAQLELVSLPASKAGPELSAGAPQTTPLGQPSSEMSRPPRTAVTSWWSACAIPTPTWCRSRIFLVRSRCGIAAGAWCTRWPACRCTRPPRSAAFPWVHATFPGRRRRPLR